MNRVDDMNTDQFTNSVETYGEQKMNHLLQDYVHASETETKKRRQAEQQFRD